MSEKKEEILDRLYEIEVKVRESASAAEKELNQTLVWLAQNKDGAPENLILDHLTKAKLLIQEGRGMAATRRVRAAIRNVRTW